MTEVPAYNTDETDESENAEGDGGEKGEAKVAAQSGDDAEDGEEEGALRDVLEQVCSALRAKAVYLQTVMPANRFQHKDSYFIFVDGDKAVQLGRIKKIYAPSSKAGKSGYTAEVKFTTASGKQDLKLANERRYGTILSCKVLAVGFFWLSKLSVLPRAPAPTSIS